MMRASCLFLAASASLGTVFSGFAQQPGPPAPRPVPAAASNAAVVPLDPWLTSASLWQTTPETFGPSARGLGFRWVSQARDAARAAYPVLRLHDLPVAEVIARFSPGTAAVPTGSPGVAPAPATLAATAGHTQLSAVQISVYNRGDAGDLEQKAFEALVERAKTALSDLTHVSPLDRGADNGSAVQSRGLVWTMPGSRYLLEWSATPENKVQGVPYRAEFIRLRVTPQKDQGKGLLAANRAAEAAAAGSARPATVRAADLPARVTREPDGGREIKSIPMVDQGQKGYCVTASTERVLRYYGVEVDQNELAQIANTDTAGGTSVDAMVAALKKLASRFKVNVVTEVNPTVPDFLREIDDYNRVARYSKVPGAAPIVTQPGTLSYELVYNQMNGEVLREARTKLNPAYVTRFEKDVQSHLDRGIPLLWSVTLGLLPEQRLNPQARGGHMRLIIGCNPQKHEIYYSDSWGMGHEFKTMSVQDAWTITTGLFTLEPI